MIEPPDKRIAVTEGDGFLGRHVVRTLGSHGFSNVFVPLIVQYDLTKEASVERFYAEARPEIVVHLAAEVGGVGANQANPGRFAYANLIMGALLRLRQTTFPRSGCASFDPSRTAGSIC